ncbi:ABC transporter ATP-binding protein [Clostridium niameyense]|uniref:ABC transporter ATP-binding protein n=1 Tax=Clostridium niameyense TaxID=1622073 RepID=A0A6M0RD61_9CLOT|nr:ABC transporter ATP-binding protein [Clostridium niameyense]NEZ47720.1 ABC transporter ATP-binding protein [Clostridium niameyense]
MLSVNNLSKIYNKFKAVDNVSFEVNNGEIAVLLGPNGAGKSTTIKSIVGLLKFEGEIKICNNLNKTIEAKRNFAYVPEVPALYELLTVYEHIEYMAKAYSIDDYKDKAEELLKRFDLWDKKDKLGRELSKGMQQKVSICCSLIINPKVILFDEPMIGLDPKAIKELKKIFLELREQGVAIIISTHIIDSINELWDKALIMNEGKIVFSRTRQELIDRNESLEEIFFEVTEG